MGQPWRQLQLQPHHMIQVSWATVPKLELKQQQLGRMQLTLSLQRQVPLQARQGPVWGAVPPPQAARRGQPGPQGFGLRGLSFPQLPSRLHMGIRPRFLVPLS